MPLNTLFNEKKLISMESWMNIEYKYSIVYSIARKQIKTSFSAALQITGQQGSNLIITFMYIKWTVKGTWAFVYINNPLFVMAKIKLIESDWIRLFDKRTAIPKVNSTTKGRYFPTKRHFQALLFQRNF